MDHPMITELLAADVVLESELQALNEEIGVLSPAAIQRKVEIKERIKQIGKERLVLFLERRKIRNGGL